MNHESEHAVGFIDAESQPLLANDSFAVSQLQEQNVESSAATRSPRTSFITAALMAAVIIMGGMAIYSSPLGIADSLVDEFIHMTAAGMSLLLSVPKLNSSTSSTTFFFLTSLYSSYNL